MPKVVRKSAAKTQVDTSGRDVIRAFQKPDTTMSTRMDPQEKGGAAPPESNYQMWVDNGLKFTGIAGLSLAGGIGAKKAWNKYVPNKSLQSPIVLRSPFKSKSGVKAAKAAANVVEEVVPKMGTTATKVGRVAPLASNVVSGAANKMEAVQNVLAKPVMKRAGAIASRVAKPLMGKALNYLSPTADLEMAAQGLGELYRKMTTGSTEASPQAKKKAKENEARQKIEKMKVAARMPQQA